MSATPARCSFSQHPSPATVLRLLRDHDEEIAAAALVSDGGDR
ncbi:hypothetical protein [Actinoplanes sp. NPDC049802]